MKHFPETFFNVAIICLSLVLILTALGCTSVPVDPTPRQQVIANAVEDVISIGLVPVLSQNYRYMGAAKSIAATLGTFSGATLTPADVDAFLAQTGIDPGDARVIAGIVNAAWDTYQRRYAQQVGASVRPDVRLFLAAVSAGIERAIAAVPKG